MIPEHVRSILTEEQLAIVENHPQYPQDLTTLTHHVTTGNVDVCFTQSRLRITPEGRVGPVPQGVSAERLAELEWQITDLRRVVENLTAMVQISLSPSQQLRCVKR